MLTRRYRWIIAGLPALVIGITVTTSLLFVTEQPAKQRDVPAQAFARTKKAESDVRSYLGASSQAAVAVRNTQSGAQFAVNGEHRLNSARFSAVSIVAATLVQHDQLGKPVSKAEAEQMRGAMAGDDVAADSVWAALGGPEALGEALGTLGLTSTTASASRATLTTTATDQLTLLAAISDPQSVLSRTNRELLADLVKQRGWAASSYRAGDWAVDRAEHITDSHGDWLVVVLADDQPTEERGLELTNRAAEIAVGEAATPTSAPALPTLPKITVKEKPKPSALAPVLPTPSATPKPTPKPPAWTRPVAAASGAISSGFRTSARPDHNGLDFAAPAGAPIYAIAAGTVIWAGCDPDTRNCNAPGSITTPGYGWYVDVQHADGTISRYGHMTRAPAVKTGQKVPVGHVLGQVGMTGNSTGPHLHFEIHTAAPVLSTNAIDPLKYLKEHGVNV